MEHPININQIESNGLTWGTNEAITQVVLATADLGLSDTMPELYTPVERQLALETFYESFYELKVRILVENALAIKRFLEDDRNKEV